MYGRYKTICEAVDRIDEFPVLLAVQYFCKVVCTQSPAHPSVLHTHRYQCTVLILLNPHFFMYHTRLRFRDLYSALVIRQEPFSVVTEVFIELLSVLSCLTLILITVNAVRIDEDVFQHLVQLFFVKQ